MRSVIVFVRFCVLACAFIGALSLCYSLGLVIGGVVVRLLD